MLQISLIQNLMIANACATAGLECRGRTETTIGRAVHPQRSLHWPSWPSAAALQTSPFACLGPQPHTDHERAGHPASAIPAFALSGCLHRSAAVTGVLTISFNLCACVESWKIGQQVERSGQPQKIRHSMKSKNYATPHNYYNKKQMQQHTKV